MTTNEVRYMEVNAEDVGQRLDNYLFRFLKGVPKSHVYRMIRGGEVRVNKKRAQVSQRLELGDRVRIPPVRMREQSPVHVNSELAQRLDACILYEDNQLLVLNKPAGIAVHGGSGVSLGVIEALRKTRPDLPYLELVHRLDKETSGCLLLAKKRSVLRAIQSLLESRTIKKTYWAIVAGAWQGKKCQVVEAALEKNTLKSGERIVVVSAAGKQAKTTFKLLEQYAQACWVEAAPETGRTHQIRVHSVHLGHPILGDAKYGREEWGQLGLAGRAPRLHLHARSIEFTLNGQVHCFQAKPDEKFNQTLQQLRQKVKE